MNNITETNAQAIKTIKTRTTGKKELDLISEYDLIADTKDYLDEYYSGCYVGCLAEKSSWYVRANAECYAKFLKVIFKAVRAAHLIRIDTKAFSDGFAFNIAFSTPMLTERDRDSLYKLSRESGFYIKIFDNKIEAKFKYAKTPFSDFRAVSQRFVYKKLKEILVF